MRCNPWRWLWGLIPIVMLSWVTYRWEAPNIQADLLERSRAALDTAGQDWAFAEFNGRDAVLKGEAPEEDAPRSAHTALRSLWGVRVVHLQTDLAKRPAAYTWSAELRDGRLRLTGFVPNEDARGAVVGSVRQGFPSAPLDDGMTIARGGPAHDVWRARIDFALKQLARMTRGAAALDGSKLTITGEAATISDYKSLRRTLSQSLPAGLALAKGDVAPPRAVPFLWSAGFERNQVVLSGHVPSEAVRDDLLARAKQAFPKVAIVDRTQVAGGAPDGWTDAAALALELLAGLTDGSAQLKDKELTLSGTAADEAAAKSVREALKRRSPARFAVSETVRFAAPARVEPEPDPIPTTPAPLPETGTLPEPPSAAEAKPEPEPVAAAPQTEAEQCQAMLSEAVAQEAIRFARASADLDARDNRVLARLAEIAKACPEARIEVSGHTDAEGAPERNQRLSKRRAKAVLDYLTRAGIEAHRLTAVGYGAERPVAPNDTSENRARNRRIELTVDPD